MGQGAAKQKINVGPNRIKGDFLNPLNYFPVHEKFQHAPRPNQIERMVVCRCWLSLKFPHCDNTHQQLWKQGINVGPCMVFFITFNKSPSTVTFSCVS